MMMDDDNDDDDDDDDARMQLLQFRSDDSFQSILAAVNKAAGLEAHQSAKAKKSEWVCT